MIVDDRLVLTVTMTTIDNNYSSDRKIFGVENENSGKFGIIGATRKIYILRMKKKLICELMV
jgi:hypothetical protein